MGVQTGDKVMDGQITWRDAILEEMKAWSDDWDCVVGSTLSPDELDIPFDPSYGSSEGAGFTLWTVNRVYFPVVYDGAEWAGSVPRNPCDEATSHIGRQ